MNIIEIFESIYIGELFDSWGEIQDGIREETDCDFG